jgi:hypothetical protein
MFGKLFKQTETISPFEELVLSYLKRNGIDEITLSQKSDISIEDRITALLEQLHFPKSLEQLIMEQWLFAMKSDPTMSPLIFAKHFVMGFQNIKMEAYAPDFVKERNLKMIEIYKSVVKTIQKMQSMLDDELLRYRIESEYFKNHELKSTIIQCTTAFAIVSLGCDQLGRYNLAYSLDGNIKQKLPEMFVPMLPAKIHELTAGGLEPFVKIGSFSIDCVSVLQQIKEEARVIDYHHLHCEPQLES